MTSKADFDAEQWSLLLEGPPIAGLLVITAARGGTLRESLSIGKAYREARSSGGEPELVERIISEQPTVDPQRYGSADQLREQGPARLREAVATLEAKAGAEEVDAYKRFVLALAERVARAHKEGGFLGIGGEEVSEEEREALDGLATTLGIERS